MDPADRGTTSADAELCSMAEFQALQQKCDQLVARVAELEEQLQEGRAVPAAGSAPLVDEVDELRAQLQTAMEQAERTAADAAEVRAAAAAAVQATSELQQEKEMLNQQVGGCGGWGWGFGCSWAHLHARLSGDTRCHAAPGGADHAPPQAVAGFLLHCVLADRSGWYRKPMRGRLLACLLA